MVKRSVADRVFIHTLFSSNIEMYKIAYTIFH